MGMMKSRQVRVDFAKRLIRKDNYTRKCRGTVDVRRTASLGLYVGAECPVSNDLCSILALEKNMGDGAIAHFWIWWVLAALLIGLELATGTFSLLALGIAFVFGGLAAWLDASLPMQLIVGGALSAIALAAAHYWRTRIAVPRAIEPL